jgi:hypothetical protein
MKSTKFKIGTLKYITLVYLKGCNWRNDAARHIDFHHVGVLWQMQRLDISKTGRGSYLDLDISTSGKIFQFYLLAQYLYLR